MGPCSLFITYLKEEVRDLEVSGGKEEKVEPQVFRNIPEFAGVAGWDPQWGLRTGAQLTWTVSALGGTQPGGIVSAPWADGNRYLSASRMGQFTP